MDYYELLGVSRSASEKELKSAFKKKAMQYKPDKGGDSEKFKQVNEAYQILSDTQKRQMYDQFGTADPQNINQPNQFHFNAGNMGDIFSQMFNDTNNFGFSFTQPRRQQKNKDIRLHYTLNLKEVYTGTGATISFKLPNGRNEVIDVPRGDLIVTIKVTMPPKWRRDKQNLYTKINVGLLDLITGTNIEVNTPEGKTISLNIPAGTKPNTTFSIPGHGIPVVRSNVRGALYVEIGVIMPRLNDEQINAIERIKRDITK